MYRNPCKLHFCRLYWIQRNKNRRGISLGLCTGGLILVGVILSNRAASSQMQEPLERLI